MIRYTIIVLSVFCSILLNGQTKTVESDILNCTKTKLQNVHLVADLIPGIQDYYDSLRINIGTTVEGKFLQTENRGRELNDSVTAILKNAPIGSKIYLDLTYQDLRDANKTRYSKTYVVRVLRQ